MVPILFALAAQSLNAAWSWWDDKTPKEVEHQILVEKAKIEWSWMGYEIPPGYALRFSISVDGPSNDIVRAPSPRASRIYIEGNHTNWTKSSWLSYHYPDTDQGTNVHKVFFCLGGHKWEITVLNRITDPFDSVRVSGSGTSLFRMDDMAFYENTNEVHTVWDRTIHNGPDFPNGVAYKVTARFEKMPPPEPPKVTVFSKQMERTIAMPKEFEAVIYDGKEGEISNIVLSAGMPAELMEEMKRKLLPGEGIQNLMARVSPIEPPLFAGDEPWFAGRSKGRTLRFLTLPSHLLQVMRFYGGPPREDSFYLIYINGAFKIVGMTYDDDEPAKK